MGESSKQQRAEKIRTEYVKTLGEKGIQLRPTTSQVIFLTETNKVVGIPSASETARGREGGWWMGLPNEYFDFIILLCQRKNDAPLDFVLPRSFFEVLWKDDLYWQYQSSSWHVKFDVWRHEDDYQLKLKGRRRPPETIRRYLGNIEMLA